MSVPPNAPTIDAPGGVHVVTGTAADGWTKVGPPVDTLADVHRRLTSQGG